MTKKHTPLAASISVELPLTAAPASATLDELRAYMAAARQAAVPRLTQRALSEQLGYPYSIVNGWENGARFIYASQFKAWAECLALDTDTVNELLERFADVLLPDERAGIATGSRVDTALNERICAFRKERRISIREMAHVTGVATGHWQRVELNASNLSVAQVRSIAKAFRLNYEWLIDGKGEPDQLTLQQTIDRLRRDNEVLESFRLQVISK